MTKAMVAIALVSLASACGDNVLGRFDVEVFYPPEVDLTAMQVASVLRAPTSGSCNDAARAAAAIASGEDINPSNNNLRLSADGLINKDACLGTRMWDGGSVALIGATDGTFPTTSNESTTLIVLVADEEAVLRLIDGQTGQGLSLPAAVGGCQSKSQVLGFGTGGAWLFSARGRLPIDVPAPIACSLRRDGRFQVISRDDDGHAEQFVVTTDGVVESHGPARNVPALPGAQQATTPRGIRVVLDHDRDALVFHHPDGAIDDRGPGSARGNGMVFALDSGVIVLANDAGRIDVTRARW